MPLLSMRLGVFLLGALCSCCGTSSSKDDLMSSQVKPFDGPDIPFEISMVETEAAFLALLARPAVYYVGYDDGYYYATGGYLGIFRISRPLVSSNKIAVTLIKKSCDFDAGLIDPVQTPISPEYVQWFREICPTRNLPPDSKYKFLDNLPPSPPCIPPFRKEDVDSE